MEKIPPLPQPAADRDAPDKDGRLRVMLVEDHALVRSAVRSAITAPDIELVAEAASAEEALRLAPMLRPDLLLLDIDLPGMTGIELVRELAPRLPATIIVMLTVSSAERDIMDAIRSGARGYLTKDLSPDALLRTIRGVARGELAMSRRAASQVIMRLARGGHRGLTGLAGQDGTPLLSARENEVLRHLADGLTDREIAEALLISRRTVETHVGNILAKLGVQSRAQAARRFRQGS